MQDHFLEKSKVKDYRSKVLHSEELRRAIRPTWPTGPAGKRKNVHNRQEMRLAMAGLGILPIFCKHFRLPNRAHWDIIRGMRTGRDGTPLAGLT